MTNQPSNDKSANSLTPIGKRFRGFLPVVVDIETGGFNPSTDALLELAAITLKMDPDNLLVIDQTYHYHVEPYPGANMDPSSLAFTGIKPYHPFRFAIPEKQMLSEFFSEIRKQNKHHQCQRAVLVGHNPFFDLSFLQAAIQRHHVKRVPFHAFTTFDTATLGALVFGQTVLAKACECAGITFDPKQAHSAIYDAKRTAELFCYIVNHWRELTNRTN